MILKNLIKTFQILDFNKSDNCIEKSLKAGFIYFNYEIFRLLISIIFKSFFDTILKNFYK
ncbi:hypothetical protein APU49_05045 [Campylobacter jejuni]|nr:hypothetical protein B2K12_02045 [Campylobacter jejuni]AQY74316.1 hypothetical protein B5D75_02045 [Campylobacter jejuni subsp. jejuni]AWB36841.1 hypothetical protein CJ12661_0398 [Campylobacter jejuni]EAI4070706.1 hypothetical protein [Campylobacter jejuni]EAI4099182.1 hypothetical protein [Campylobacter jejuni]